uniref:Uncharacterized protein n=1 Tax=Triticum urartu TaxID=4572 RepID=A0A8R7PKE8_TRIUA
MHGHSLPPDETTSTCHTHLKPSGISVLQALARSSTPTDHSAETRPSTPSLAATQRHAAASVAARLPTSWQHSLPSCAPACASARPSTAAHAPNLTASHGQNGSAGTPLLHSTLRGAPPAVGKPAAEENVAAARRSARTDAVMPRRAILA